MSSFCALNSFEQYPLTVFMDESKEEGSAVWSISESTVTVREEVGGETLERSVECVNQGPVVCSLPEEFVGKSEASCNRKDKMVEVLGSNVYIDGVCTCASDAGLNGEMGHDGSVEVAPGLDKDGKALGGDGGVVNEVEVGIEGSVIAQSLKSENATAELDGALVQREELLMSETVFFSDKNDVASRQKSCEADEGKEVGTEVVNSYSVGKTSIETEVPAEHLNAEEAGVRDGKVANTRFDIEELNAVEDPQEIDEGSGNSNNLVKEVDAGARVALDRVPFDSEENQHCNSDTGQGTEVDEQLHSENQETGGGSTDGDTQVCNTVQGMEVNEHFDSENQQRGGGSTNGDTQVYNIEEVSLTDGISDYTHKDPGHALNEQEEKSSDCLQKDFDCDFRGVYKDNCGPEQDSLHKGNEVAVEDGPMVNKIVNQTAHIQGIPMPCGAGAQNTDAVTISRSLEKDTEMTDGGYFAPIGAEEDLVPNSEAPSSPDNQVSEFMEPVNHSVTTNVTLADSNVTQTYGGEVVISESHGRQEREVGEINDTEQQKPYDEKVIKRTAKKPGSSGGYQACYQLPPEKKGEFSVSDMVWAKVRSHPWWPGQIFDPSDSSEKAMKHYKKDCFLVAYFGDRTFAWNEASQLKSFRTHFASIAKQSNSETFQNAVDSALDEVSRRVEFGLACSCIPKDIYNRIQFQTVENTGIRPEITYRHGADESLTASYFSPKELVRYLKMLSRFPSDGFHRLELVVAKAQLLAFHHLKGYSCLPEFQYCGTLDDEIDSLLHDTEKFFGEVIQQATPVSRNDNQASAGQGISKSQNSSRHKRKHNLKDGMYHKKERSMSELMGGTPDSPDGDYWFDEKGTDNLVSPNSSKRRKTSDTFSDDSGRQDQRKTISLAKVSNTRHVPKQSFKIGDCIRRVASQLTKSPSISKCTADRSLKQDGSTDGFAGDDSDISFQNLELTENSNLIAPAKYSSLDELLSLFQLIAHDPLGDYSFSNVIVSFFSDFRNSIIVGNYSGREISPTEKVGNKRKKRPIAGSPETFEFEDMSDTYWSDRVIENGSEDQPSKNKRRDDQSVPADPEKPRQVYRRSKKRYSDSIHVEAPEKPSGYIDGNSPAELVMNFADLNSVPSEASLNKMFRRFGALKESETEVDRLSSRARVVFKKCADAEVACSSAKKFNIFGAVLVNYQLNYAPSALFKASSVATLDQEMHLDFSNFEVHVDHMI